MIRFLALNLLLAVALSAAPLDLRLPTENHHLFTGELDRFYMYVDRNFEGQVTKPWEAGSYGFVRTAIRVNDQVLLTKFHEGIDISPVKRDKAGNPLDLVSSIAAGRVAHVSPIAGRSNYGKYVVVEHPWENSAVYSIYAHLAEITCKPGDPVNAGSVLGRMGYTGAGIDRTRAHCHLELGMMLSSRYEDWHRKFGGGTNYHGPFNGMNICGAEVARFFVEQKANPELQFSQFIASTPVYFKVTIPSQGTPDFVKRYPWITHGSAEGAVSWEISFSATGLPVAIDPSKREVTAPTVTSIRPSTVPHRYLTRGLIHGEGNHATLTESGHKLIALLTDNFPITQ
jgi:murein DD-endopeptidase MepM/ murein hydrolase activator NlpD